MSIAWVCQAQGLVPLENQYILIILRSFVSNGMIMILGHLSLAVGFNGKIYILLAALITLVSGQSTLFNLDLGAIEAKLNSQEDNGGPQVITVSPQELNHEEEDDEDEEIERRFPDSWAPFFPVFKLTEHDEHWIINDFLLRTEDMDTREVTNRDYNIPVEARQCANPTQNSVDIVAALRRKDTPSSIRVIGGRKAEEEDFPFIVALVAKGQFCAGTLIAVSYSSTKPCLLVHHNLMSYLSQNSSHDGF